MPRKEISQLHFIRVLAMAGIFLHHLWMGLGSLRSQYKGGLLDHAFVDMALGVVVFNLMTAFLMALPFVGKNPAAMPNPFEFVRKRLARICPQYYLSVFVFSLISALVFGSGGFVPLGKAILERVFFLQTFDYQSFMSNLAAYWWLGLLMQFTVCFPLMLRAVRRYGPAKACVGSALIIWPLIELIKAWGRAYPEGWPGLFSFLFTFNLPARLPEFFAGMWMAAAYKEDSARPWPMDKGMEKFLGICLALSLLWALTPLPTPHFSGAVWSMAVFVGLYRLPWVEKMGQKKWVIYGSAASYSVYLAHQPLLSYFDALFTGFDPGLEFFLLLLLAGYTSLLAAYALDYTASRLEGKN